MVEIGIGIGVEAVRDPIWIPIWNSGYCAIEQRVNKMVTTDFRIETVYD